MVFLAHRNRKLMMRRGYPEYFVPLVFTFLACSYIMFPMWVQLAVTVLCMAAGRLYPGCICIALSKTSARCDQIVPTVRHTTTHSDTPTPRAVCKVVTRDTYDTGHIAHSKCLLVCKLVTHDTYNTGHKCLKSVQHNSLPAVSFITARLLPRVPRSEYYSSISHDPGCRVLRIQRILSSSWYPDVTRFAIELEIQISYLASRTYRLHSL